jgi:hypothetical protein
MSKCIAVLTRGYNDINQYEDLIKRNKHISNNLQDKSIDILFFHEGNILEDQQLFIKNETPELKLKFINISNIDFQYNKINIQFEEAELFGLSYRHMCSFWFINFFDVINEYDKILRIDEDCFIDSNIDNIFLQLDEYLFICGKIEDDYEYVTKGLNTFSLNFVEKFKNEYSFKKNDDKKPNGPYTNLFGISLNKVRSNDIFQKYKDEIDKNDFIYKRRWGDLPLWGEVIYYIFGNDSLHMDDKIKYFHKSHLYYVNSNT